MEVLSSSGKRKDHFFQEWKKARGQLLLLGTHYYVWGIVSANGHHQSSRRILLLHHLQADGLIFPFIRREAIPQRL